MKVFSKYPAHKLILYGCFIPALFHILLYEFVLTKYPSTSLNIYKAGLVGSKISYSIVAASLFYFISQYIPIYLPKQERKIKILFAVFQKTQAISSILQELRYRLDVQNEEYKDEKIFRQKLENINLGEQIGTFENWFAYLAYVKERLLELIKSMTFYNEHLSKEFFHELIIIEKQLIASHTFGNNVLGGYHFMEIELDLQEVFIHNGHLQQLSQTEFKKYESKFQQDGVEYRKKYYKEYDDKKGSS